MTRILITGGPRTGKTTLADELGITSPPPPGFVVPIVRHSDDLIAELAHLGKDAWSEGSRRVAEWLSESGPWIIEGVAASRGLRKYRDQHPGEPPPVDRVIYLREPHEPWTSGQRSMAKGVETVHREIEPWLDEHGVRTEYR